MFLRIRIEQILLSGCLLVCLLAVSGLYGQRAPVVPRGRAGVRTEVGRSLFLKKRPIGLFSEKDYSYLEGLVKDVLENARLYPRKTDGRVKTRDHNNHTGGILIRPGGAYPSFWIRDYAMSLESGFVGRREQEHMLVLTASTQCDRTWITAGGSMVPYGAIADHIRPEDGLPIYYPGTYNYEEQGTDSWGKMPPYDDQYYFIHMAYYFVNAKGNANVDAKGNANGNSKRNANWDTDRRKEILTRVIGGMRLITRLELAFRVPPSHPDSHIVYTTDAFRGVDFGFRDAERITGDLCFPSILKYRASEELAGLFGLLGDQKKVAEYRAVGERIKEALPRLFADDRGMLHASTGKSRQADVWSTALAVYYGLLKDGDLLAACGTLAVAYKKGELAYKGNIRHILTTDDFNDSTAWEFSLAAKNTYQNGAYWGTPTGWVCYAIAKVDRAAAKQLASEYINDLRETDFRKGLRNGVGEEKKGVGKEKNGTGKGESGVGEGVKKEYGGPYECFYPPDYKQNPVYLTTVSCPYGVFRAMKREDEEQ